VLNPALKLMQGYRVGLSMRRRAPAINRAVLSLTGFSCGSESLFLSVSLSKIEEVKDSERISNFGKMSTLQ
jgi:hypothetical protein